MLFTADHEWIRLEDEGIGVVGITDYAQEQLGELVYVELPEVGAEVARGDEIGVIESVKAAGELNAPASGTVTEVNPAVVENPAIANEDPTGDGWFIKLELSDPADLGDLMDEEGYRHYVEGLE